MLTRVLLLIPSMANPGGAERVVDMLSKLLESAGYEVAQASFDDPHTNGYFQNNCTLHTLGPVLRLPLPLRFISYGLSAWRLWRLKRRLEIQVTISNLWRADLISILSGGTDKKVALCHTNILGNASNSLMVRFLPLVARVYRRFDRVVSVSAPLSSELQTLYGLELGKTRHIENFIERTAATNILPTDGRIRFVWCGRFSPEKNLNGLLYAWSEVARLRRDLQLVLLGEGPLFLQMQLFAQNLGLSCCSDVSNTQAQVVFVGRVHNPTCYLVGARAMLLCSHAEGLPMVLLEALSLGTPVLASDCPAGGVRQALMGSGTCFPNRLEAESTPAGYLLPVPDPSQPTSLWCWRDAVMDAVVGEALVSQWRQGALERAQHFSSAAALTKWQSALTFEQAYR